MNITKLTSNELQAEINLNALQTAIEGMVAA